MTRIRSFICLILFFVTACSTSRDGDEAGESVSIRWKDNRAVAIILPKKYNDLADDSLKNTLTVHLKGATNAPAILGEYFKHDGQVQFEPLIPFTRKSAYELRFRGMAVAEILIPEPDESQFPALLGIFPTQDTLPQNLLKFYFHFSKPMREGQSLQHIFLLKDESDTVAGAFLDLQPELWNEDGTMFTLWLDPGRIKRDLQPNRMLGEPLLQGVNYQLVIKNTWTDIHGAKLKDVSVKKFLVSERDTLSPDPAYWTMTTPGSGTLNPLEIDFHENLDYALSASSIRIIDNKGNAIQGEIKREKEESVFFFFPGANWESGAYTIRCESRLEDLAGNNLNRPFDLDITQTRNKKEQNFFTLKFIIR